MTSPINNLNSSPVIPPDSNPWQIPSNEPGKALPKATSVDEEQKSSKSCLRTCGYITTEVLRYPTGALSGTVLFCLFPLALLANPVLLVGSMCCDYNPFRAHSILYKAYNNAIQFCFRGFRTKEQCAKEGCCRV